MRLWRGDRQVPPGKQQCKSVSEHGEWIWGVKEGLELLMSCLSGPPLFAASAITPPPFSQHLAAEEWYRRFLLPLVVHDLREPGHLALLILVAHTMARAACVSSRGTGEDVRWE